MSPVSRRLPRFLDKLLNRQAGLFIAVVTVIAILVLIGWALSGLGGQSETEQLQIAADAIERAARQCYALEGAYPPTLDYLEENYGLMLDWTRYHYFYDVIGSNIHPIIEVQLK